MIFGTQQLDWLWSWMKKFIPPQSKNRSKGLVNPRLWNGVFSTKSEILESWKKKRSEYTSFGGMSQHEICISCGPAHFGSPGGRKDVKTVKTPRFRWSFGCLWGAKSRATLTVGQASGLHLTI